MSFDFVGSSPEAFLLVVVIAFALLDFVRLLLQFGELAGEFVTLVEKFAHLRQQHHVGEVQAAVLVVVAEVRIALLTHR